MSHRNKIFTVLLTALIIDGVWAADTGWKGPPIYGSFHAYSKNQPGTKMNGKIYVNREGLRSEMSLPTGQMITIMNGKLGKCWYVLSSKKIFMEAGMDRKTWDCPSFMGEAMDASADKSPAEVVPCDGYSMKSSQGSATIAGRATEKWSCSGGRRAASATQWHDRKLHFLLKEETSDGEVMEFREFHEKSFPSSLLEMPKGMKRVSGNEFRKVMFGGMMPLGLPPPGMPPR